MLLGSLGLAFVTLLVGRLVAGLTVLVTLALLMIHHLGLVQSRGDIVAGGIHRQRPHLDAVGFLLMGLGSGLILGRQRHAGKRYSSKCQ